MELYALIIPVLAAIIVFMLFKKKVVWWELSLPIVVCTLAILITRYTAEKIMVSDTDYRGGMVVEARYYEPWTTWVDKTCSYTTTSGSGKNQTTTTHYYDCSYCDEHSARYEVLDNQGNTWTVDKSKYEELKSRWQSAPKFVELNRRIEHHGSLFGGGCGIDGDMYRVNWNGEVKTSEASSWKHSYENKIKAARSAFNYLEVTKKEAREKGLYDYPPIYDQYKQEAILGADSIYKGATLDSIKHLYRYANGAYGPSKRVKIFVLLFYNKPIDIAFLQEAYWIGGNHNEFIVCIGLDKSTKKIDWVKPFTWADNKRVSVETREEVANLQYFEPTKVYGAIVRSVNTYFSPKSFKDFHYLSVELPTWAIVLIWVLTLGITIWINYWSIKNDISNE